MKGASRTSAGTIYKQHRYSKTTIGSSERNRRNTNEKTRPFKRFVYGGLLQHRHTVRRIVPVPIASYTILLFMSVEILSKTSDAKAHRRRTVNSAFKMIFIKYFHFYFRTPLLIRFYYYYCNLD